MSTPRGWHYPLAAHCCRPDLTSTWIYVIGFILECSLEILLPAHLMTVCGLHQTSGHLFRGKCLQFWLSWLWTLITKCFSWFFMPLIPTYIFVILLTLLISKKKKKSNDAINMLEKDQIILLHNLWSCIKEQLFSIFRTNWEDKKDKHQSAANTYIMGGN